MRVSDDRYNRDRLRFDLALRMLRHGARARTIRAWTGLSDDRLRKLYRAYLMRRSERPTYRVRAKVPHHASCFLRSSALGFEATTLACLFYILGLLASDEKPDRATPVMNPLSRAETFCQAYETYLALYPSARLSFEHSWFLLESLATRDGVKLNVCGQCRRLYLTDLVRIDLSSCGCGGRRLALPRRRRVSLQRTPRITPVSQMVQEGDLLQ
jgi:hypothetical protein